MTYYPVLQAPDCEGFVTLSNFPPNNWEDKSKKSRLVHVTWSTGNEWKSQQLGQIEFGKFFTVTEQDLRGIVPTDCLRLLSLSESELPEVSDELPEPVIPKTVLPGWRATLGLRFRGAETSYQGEIMPFPPKASLLTFGSFLQRGPQVRNYMLLVNLTKSPQQCQASLQMLEAENNTVYHEVGVKTNAVNIIDLETSVPSTNLPLFFSREMTGIPLYLSLDMKNDLMSLEHTHPPASIAIHGNRWSVQHKLKENWFGK